MATGFKVWLITGSSRGLGKALTQAALNAGDHVIATARNTGDIDFLKMHYPQQVTIAKLDVTDAVNANETVHAAIEKYGRIDVLVNNAGYGYINSIEETSLEDFRAQIETNLFGTIILTKAVLPFMRKNRSGHIVQFSSVGGLIGPIGRGAYATAKWGVEGFSEVLAKEVQPFNVAVTIIEPGGFRTDFAGASYTIAAGLPDYAETVGVTAWFQQQYNGNQPGDPDKAAAAILAIVNTGKPPLRLLLGSDAVAAVAANDEKRLQELEKWKHVSQSTDF
ncbi:oxidoreductase [Foetidibacter luteolus]|uniref:oxidoreductase n=1 Tax=Foetidibacter luteolus TaxID=2608880 RepID=UPI00129B7F85|nr:oxidoreductase [Foetidibacter luteolus]